MSNVDNFNLNIKSIDQSYFPCFSNFNTVISKRKKLKTTLATVCVNSSLFAVIADFGESYSVLKDKV